MKRYYRTLLLVTLLGIAIGIAGGLLDQHMLALTGCLVVPAASYLIAVVIDLVRRRR